MPHPQCRVLRLPNLAIGDTNRHQRRVAAHQVEEALGCSIEVAFRVYSSDQGDQAGDHHACQDLVAVLRTKLTEVKLHPALSRVLLHNSFYFGKGEAIGKRT